MLRKIKDRIIKGIFFKILLKIVNLPIIGSVYDFFYFKSIRKKVNDGALSLTIEPSNICNLQCVMCPYQRMKRKKSIMPMPLFKKIVDEAVDMNVKDISLQHYNEPFLDKHIFERIAYIRQKKPDIEIVMYSNGTLLDDDIRSRILENPPDVIRFSVDGATKETFESIRKGAVFEEVVSNIHSLFLERFNCIKPKIEVYFTVMPKNKDEASLVQDFWKGRCDYASVYPADSRESEEFSIVSYNNMKPYPCFNPNKITILSNGKAALCCIDVDGSIELGDTNIQTLKEIINSNKFIDVYNSQMNRNCRIDICRSCSKLYIDSAFKWWVE